MIYYSIKSGLPLVSAMPLQFSAPQHHSFLSLSLSLFQECCFVRSMSIPSPMQPSTEGGGGTVKPPPPEEPLVYPIVFSKLFGGGDEEDYEAAAGAAAASPMQQVSIFTALHWLLPVFEMAEWIPKQQRHRSGAGEKQPSAGEAGEAGDFIQHDDVRSALELLPLFARFFVEASKMVPQHSALYYYTESFAVPTPRGPKTITRSKVEGDYRAVHQPSHAPSQLGGGSTTATTVTNSTAYFSLLPGHNHFLLYYEEQEKLRHFNYLQLDQLRFAWIAVRELMDENKVFNLNDGSLSGLARRDLKRNNSDSPFCLHAPLPSSAADQAAGGGGGTAAAADASRANRVVGRGGGNARLHQGTSGNVITAPSKELLDEKKKMQQKAFLKGDLEAECVRRWPYTPAEKSLIFTYEECAAGELPEAVQRQLGITGTQNQTNSRNTKRRGPRYYLGQVELPLLNKKGPPARFKAARWWTVKKDAESDAAEVALSALRLIKS